MRERLVSDSALDGWQRDIRGYRAVVTIIQLRDAVSRSVSEQELARKRSEDARGTGRPADEVLAQLSRNLDQQILALAQYRLALQRCR